MEAQTRTDWRPTAGIPRRNCLDLNTPAELAIRHAVGVVEEAGCHPLLTEAVVLLGQARDKVSDFVDLPPQAMTKPEADKRTAELFGEDSFTECDRSGDRPRYYVGACPTTPGKYEGFMGFSWEEALALAEASRK
jgi:hypothetical protein